jgi:copper chaperone
MEAFNMEKTVIKVDGMSCDYCGEALTKAVTALSGIDGVYVDLKAGTVTVEHDPARSLLDKMGCVPDLLKTKIKTLRLRLKLRFFS